MIRQCRYKHLPNRMENPTLGSHGDELCSSLAKASSPRAITMQVNAAAHPNRIGLISGINAIETAMPDHAIPIQRYAVQKFPLFANKTTEVIAAHAQ